MGYDQELAERIAAEVENVPGISSRAMFGGLSWMVGGNMACGIIGDELCVRVGPDAYDEVMQEAHTREFDFSGRPMRGWVMVTAAGLSLDDDLTRWVARGLDFAASLPPK